MEEDENNAWGLAVGRFHGVAVPGYLNIISRGNFVEGKVCVMMTYNMLLNACVAMVSAIVVSSCAFSTPIDGGGGFTFFQEVSHEDVIVVRNMSKQRQRGATEREGM